LGSGASVSTRLLRGVIRSLADVVVGSFVIVAGGRRREERRRVVVVVAVVVDGWVETGAVAVPTDLRRGILEGEGGTGRGTVDGLMELRRRLGGMMSERMGHPEGQRCVEVVDGDGDGDVWTRLNKTLEMRV
jgi:hypothetical protein